MGLDICYYSGLKEIDAVFDPDGEPIDPQTREPIDDFFMPYINDDFPGREGNLKNKAVYLPDQSVHFKAGAYSSYNRWRDELAKLAGWPEIEHEGFQNFVRKSHAASAWQATEGPFWELINFSDCEGVIGPEAAAKLATDFAEHQSAADSHPDERFRELYEKWRIAFETAANNGAVEFR